mmetsp:Transcript_23424/g.49705  ORF Transcript_23424/g.49705 Transcript_23424/m.49705 type:complete len:276 (+) Transcript_23424:126-953(+)
MINYCSSYHMSSMPRILSRCHFTAGNIKLLNTTGKPRPNFKEYQRRFFMTHTYVELLSKNIHSGTDLIKPYLRTCLVGDFPEDGTSRSAEFTVSFLGTGRGSPGRHRNSSCTALRLGGQTYLFDAGEGTQRQLAHTRILPLSINKIFITQMHGDHVFGLVPLILKIQSAAKAQLDESLAARRRGRGRRVLDRLPLLEIYGPPGLYNFINMSIALSCSKINYLDMHIIELVGGRNGLGPTALSRKKSVFLQRYPEIDTPGIRRVFLKAVSLQNDFC